MTIMKTENLVTKRGNGGIVGVFVGFRVIFRDPLENMEFASLLAGKRHPGTTVIRNRNIEQRLGISNSKSSETKYRIAVYNYVLQTLGPAQDILTLRAIFRKSPLNESSVIY